MLSLPSTSTAKCEICFLPSHGNHFGAFSCRACAAFFKRSLAGNYEGFKCRMGDGRCQAKKNGSFNCKRCRLDQCFEAGMTPKKLQHDRDLNSSTDRCVLATKRKNSSSTIPQSLQGFVGRPLFILSCEPDVATDERTFIDVKFLINHVLDFFAIQNTTSNPSECSSSMSMLDKLSCGLESSRLPTNGKIKVCKKIGKAESLLFWENDIMKVAKWLTYCDEFQQFPRNIKLQFLKSSWYMWMRLERIANAAASMKNNQSIFAITNDFSIDINSDFDISWITKYRKDQLTYFMQPLDCLFVQHITDPLNQLEPTIKEMTYMLCLLSFRHGGKHLDGDIQKMTERLIENLANDLHNYYFNDLKLVNYAGRMAKMMHIVQLVEKDVYERMEKTEIARLFDIFILDLSHPEMFFGYKR